MPKRNQHSVSVVARAALWSSGLHLFGLLLLWQLATRPGGKTFALDDMPLPFIVPPWQAADEEVAVDLAAEEAFDLSRALVTVPDRPPLPEGDSTTFDPRPSSGERGRIDERAPAPDEGSGTGRKTDSAYRRDASTLRARLSDGAALYESQRERSAAQASSPQAMRQEPRVGIGDSARSRRPRTEARPPDEVELPEAEASADDQMVIPEAPLATPALGPGADSVRGDGPLAVEAGRRTFDVTEIGTAKEAIDTRAASNELHPGLTDFSAPSSVKGDTHIGQGPGEAPGVTKAPKEGAAPSVAGVRIPVAIGAIGEGSDERVYAREHLQIRQKVARALRFPRRLAVMLEQGEAIVLFLVDRDGRVSGDVKLEKSAGFEEFDREAVEVVRRAAPFPPLPKKLQVRMRIPFENPMIQ